MSGWMARNALEVRARGIFELTAADGTGADEGIDTHAQAERIGDLIGAFPAHKEKGRARKRPGQE